MRSTNPIKYNSKSTASFRHLCSFYLILVGVWFGLLHHLTWHAGWHSTTRACWSVSLPRILSNMSGKTNWFKGLCYQHDDRYDWYDIINISILGMPWLLYLWTFSWTLRAGCFLLNLTGLRLNIPISTIPTCDVKEGHGCKARNMRPGRGIFLLKGLDREQSSKGKIERRYLTFINAMNFTCHDSWTLWICDFCTWRKTLLFLRPFSAWKELTRQMSGVTIQVPQQFVREELNKHQPRCPNDIGR